MVCVYASVQSSESENNVSAPERDTLSFSFVLALFCCFCLVGVIRVLSTCRCYYLNVNIAESITDAYICSFEMDFHESEECMCCSMFSIV